MSRLLVPFGTGGVPGVIILRPEDRWELTEVLPLANAPPSAAPALAPPLVLAGVFKENPTTFPVLLGCVKLEFVELEVMVPPVCPVHTVVLSSMTAAVSEKRSIPTLAPFAFARMAAGVDDKGAATTETGSIMLMIPKQAPVLAESSDDADTALLMGDLGEVGDLDALERGDSRIESCD
jgi:hypothetical protein